MKVLWITNIVFPEANAILNGQSSFKSSGGWMLAAANSLLAKYDIELIVATPCQNVNSLTELRGRKIRYYLFPLGKGNQEKNDEYRKYWRQIYDALNPDVVHIHGTEFSHGLAFVDECGADKVIVSIQGLTSVIYKYYNYGLNVRTICQNLTLGDLLQGGGIIHDAKRMKKRGEFEVELLKKVNHVIGRTDWDRAHVWAINPNIKYHFCNETLRDEFYSGRWSYETCTKFSLFLSQANYPIKGFHIFLKALPLVMREFPDLTVRVGGREITKHDNTLRGIYGYSGYGRFIKTLIKQLGLDDKITFLGPLNAEEMKHEYLSCNAFVSPSSIENSPNSLCEAQMLGVPCVASYVGGISNIIPNRNCGYLYRFEEIEMLAYAICDLFRASPTFNNTIIRKEALQRHDKVANSIALMNIYKLL